MNFKLVYKAYGFILALIFIVFAALALSGGLKLHFANAKNQKIVFFESGSFIIFMGGAVENEGFYEVRYSTTYGELFNTAKVLNDSSLVRFNYGEAINPFEEFIICNFENFIDKNINYATAEALTECGISLKAANDIVNYIGASGYIKNKYDLVEKGLLTIEEYNTVQYKIYAYII